MKPNASPPVALRRINAAAIVFTAGYDNAGDVPAPIQQAILTIMATLYAHRGDAAAEIPQEALALLAPYRVVKL